MDYLDDLQKTQTISKETAQAIRDYIDGKVSTGRVAAHIVTKLREEFAHKDAWVDNKIIEHDLKIKEQESFLTKIKRGLNGIIK